MFWTARIPMRRPLSHARGRPQAVSGLMPDPSGLHVAGNPRALDEGSLGRYYALSLQRNQSRLRLSYEDSQDQETARRET